MKTAKNLILIVLVAFLALICAAIIQHINGKPDIPQTILAPGATTFTNR